MSKGSYVMESEDEAFRLDIKIDDQEIEQQAKWAGIKPGMRVADFGCGPGRISAILHRLVQPGGEVVGVDGSIERIEYAKSKYGTEGIRFVTQNIAQPLDNLGMFDFVWVRLVMEYYRSSGIDLVENFTNCLKPGGTICLVDIDHNPYNFYGMSPRLYRAFTGIMNELEEKHDFDPIVGRKLYSFLYDLGFDDIDAKVETYKAIFGEVSEGDIYNLIKKTEVVSRRIDFDFKEYEGGFDEFFAEVEDFFSDPRRFAYATLILCSGKKKG